jgi:hypothetical protein
MPVTVAGMSLDDLVWNVTTIGDRLVTAGRRGGNVETGNLDGTVWRANKPLAELTPTLSMWLLGSDPHGEFPDSLPMRMVMRARLDTLLKVMGQQEGLVEVVDTETSRRCFAEIVAALAPDTMAAGSRAEVQFPLVVPAGCWEDVAEFDTGAVVLGASTNVTVPCSGSTLPTVGLRIELTPPASNLLITTPQGRWVRFNGALPAGVYTVLDLNPRLPAAYQSSTPATSLLAATELPDVQALTLPASSTNPVLTVTATGTSAASRIRVRGRRRWQTA